jgi:hypothetical protein
MPERANSGPLLGWPVFADYFPHSSQNDLQNSTFKIIVPARALRASFQPAEAETSRNSLSWTILQGTSLFSGFYSGPLPVS